MENRTLAVRHEKLNLNVIINLAFARPNSFIPPEEIILTSIEFPDVSKYQGQIDWDVMASKTKNVIIRAGHGIEDPYFSINWAAAKARGMSRGTYLFYDDRMSPMQHLDLLVSILKNDLPEDVIWIDWEALYGGQFTGLKNVVALMQLIEAKYPGQAVGMYTGYYFFVENSNAITNYSQYNYLKNKPLWLAQYTSNDVLKVPKPWTVPELHQYGTPSRGYEFGCKSIEIDMNRVISNFPRYDDQNGEQMPTYRYKATAIGSGTRIRTDHNTAANYVNSYPAGTIFEGDELFVATQQLSNANGIYQKVGDQWLKVTKVNGLDPVSSSGQAITYPVWVAVIHLGTPICTIVDNGPVTPPVEPVPPQSVIIVDDKGVTWKCTTFTRVI